MVDKTNKNWWEPHPLDKYDQWKLLEIAESANPPKINDAWFCNIELPAKDGWKVVFFYDAGKLDYIESFVMPDGTRLEVWVDDYQSEHWPPVMNWCKVGDLKRIYSFKENFYN